MGSLFCYTTFRKDSFLGTNGVPMEVLAWEMKKILLYGAGVLALGLLAFYGLKLYNGTNYQEEDGTNTNAASKSLDEFFAEIEEYYPDLYEKISDDKETFTIPGLVQTKTIIAEGEEEGESEQTEDMTPQGLALVENYLIISAYSKSQAHHSVLWIVDRQNGDYLKTIVLPTTSHVGGIAYDDNEQRLWMTTTDENSASQISALDLDTLKQEDFSHPNQEVAFDHQYYLAEIEKSSYMTYADGHLLVGYFDKEEQGHMGIFALDENGFPIQKSDSQDSYLPQQVVDTPEQVQGVGITDRQVIFSQSYGNKDSKVLYFENPGLDQLPHFEEDQQVQQELVVPPYLQQIVAEDQSLYLLFESSAFKYRLNPTVTSIDRVIKIQLGD